MAWIGWQPTEVTSSYPNDTDFGKMELDKALHSLTEHIANSVLLE